MAMLDLYPLVQIAVGIFSWLCPRSPRRPAVNERPVTVVALTSPEEDVFNNALDVYQCRFPAAQRARPEDLIRWIRQDRESGKNPLRPRDMLLAAVDGEQVRAILAFTFYPKSRLVFFAYFATRPGLTRNELVGVSSGLIHKVRNILDRQCVRPAAVLAEVESPDIPGINQRERNRRIARIMRLIQLAATEGVVLRKLAIDYYAPKIHPDAPGEGGPMLLLYGRLSGRPKECISYKEAKRILAFVYSRVYGESFDYDPDLDRRYRDHVDRIHNMVLANINKQQTIFLTDPLPDRMVRADIV